MTTKPRILLPLLLPLLLPACTDYGCKPEDHTICQDAITYQVDSCGNISAEGEQCICGCDPVGVACRTPCGCRPDCFGRECGPDGCGRYCDPGCNDAQVCSLWGECTGADCYDQDGDGYGSGTFCLGPDCNDQNPYVYPGAREFCEDGIDQDCDGRDIDCNALCNSPTLNCTQAGDTSQGRDADGDLWGECCDCDESDPNVHPGRSEIMYNGLDDDCDPTTPDNDTLVDQDRDGYEAQSAGGQDCDDEDPAVNPGAYEACNGRDDDCDGQTDEGCYQDGDDGEDAFDAHADGGVDGGVDGGGGDKQDGGGDY